MDTRRVLFVACLALALIPASAGALLAQSDEKTPPVTQESIEDRTPQDALVPFIGYNAGGSLLDAISQARSSGSKPKSYGASILFWGPGLLAGELDFGNNPQFYKSFTDVVKSGASSNLLTLTLNFVLGPTFFIGENMRIRPYGLIGGGLMRSKIDEFARAPQLQGRGQQRRD